MKKGSITIYMSLMMAVLLSLFLTVIEGAKSRAVSLRAGCAFDLAVYSVFAEYNRELFEEFGLFFIDTSYGEQSASVERVSRHLQFYMERNLDAESPGQMVFDFTKCCIQQAEITGIRYATDERGEVFKKQAAEYMKHAYGISCVEKIKKETETAGKNQLFTTDFSAQRKGNQEKIDEAETEGIETGEVDEEGVPVKKKVDIESPAESVEVTRSKGILVLVTDAEDSLSERSTDLSVCVSENKPVTKGSGISGGQSVTAVEELLFDAYILEKCGTYRNPKEEGELQYQAEYVLAGKNNDMDNLKSVVHRLLLLRETCNCVYLLSDGAKVSEAATLATSICTAAGAPVLIEPVKYTLLFAWGYAEAIYDVKQLLAGGSVPLLKTGSTWHYSLSGMLGAEAEPVTEENIEIVRDGLSYEEYLRMFLTVENKTQKVYRMMDIAEMDVRKNSKFEGFCIENCVDCLVMEATVASKYGYYKELKRTYSYT